MIVRLLFDDLGRHVKWRSFERSENLSFVAHWPCKSKIAQLNDTVAGHQDVLRLHVSVGDSVCVNVMKGPDKLLGDFPDFFDFKTLIIFDYVKKFALAEFCDQDEFSLSLKRIKE